jgi:hypothetical protein
MIGGMSRIGATLNFAWRMGTESKRVAMLMIVTFADDSGSTSASFRYSTLGGNGRGIVSLPVRRS